MAENINQLPKSLHTITVLVNLTRHFSEVDDQPYEDALERAINVLGLDTKNDIHGLVPKVAKQIGIDLTVCLTAKPAPRGWSHAGG